MAAAACPIDPVTLALVDWQPADDGGAGEVPVSRQFGDVYFSKKNGLDETRHVFLQGNDLAERLSRLQSHQMFVIAETGFGTGLNFLAVWQLWQQVRREQPARAGRRHFISVEKYPLSLADLTRALASWPELADLSAQLLAQYPLPIAGCHRLQFADEALTLDLWLGEAAQCLPLMTCLQGVDAWFLDGFAPSCNPELWQEQIFTHIVRLSRPGTTFASFSVAGVVKRALREHGIVVKRPPGFGHKREMLKAYWPMPEHATDPFSPGETDGSAFSAAIQRVTVIGAGIAGLSCAYALARRGVAVDLVDEQPLSGASGNPLALLNPKLSPIAQAAQHVMTVTWQYARRFYPAFNGVRRLTIHQIVAPHEQSMQQLTEQYPSGVLRWQSDPADQLLVDSVAVAPAQLAQQIFAHPLIEWHAAAASQLTLGERCQVKAGEHRLSSDAIILCNARAAQELLDHSDSQVVPLPRLRVIRGQVDWASVAKPFGDHELQQAFGYGGYCVALDREQLLFGASFIQNDEATVVREADHQHNLALLQQYHPVRLATDEWQGRAALRAQTPDYLPLVGQTDESRPLWALLGLGSKGFMFAPLCAELLVSQLLGEPWPMPADLAHKLRVRRFRQKVGRPMMIV